MKKIISYFKDGYFEEHLGCVALAFVIIPVVINIINRSFLNRYSTPIEATALLAYVWIGYGFFGYMYKKDAHVEMRFIVNMLPPKARAVFDLIRDIFIFVVSCYLCYWGIKLTRTNVARYVSGTKIPLAIGYASIVFGYFSGALRSGWALVGRLFRKKETEVTPDE